MGLKLRAGGREGSPPCYARLPAEVMIFEPSLWPQACVNAASRCNKRVITRELLENMCRRTIAHNKMCGR
eukprot:scaffold80039_cov27-Attheya_sp.AAC.1